MKLYFFKYLNEMSSFNELNQVIYNFIDVNYEFSGFELEYFAFFQ